MRRGDIVRIKLRNDPQQDKLYSGYIVKVLKYRPYSKLLCVTTDGVNLNQHAKFTVWLHASEVETIQPEDVSMAWIDSTKSGLVHEFRKG